MSFCIGTGIRVAIRLLTETDLLLRRKDNDLHPQALFPKRLECLPRNRPGNRLRRQIEYLFSKPFPHCFHSRENAGNRLAYPCRSLDKQLLLP